MRAAVAAGLVTALWSLAPAHADEASTPAQPVAGEVRVAALEPAGPGGPGGPGPSGPGAAPPSTVPAAAPVGGPGLSAPGMSAPIAPPQVDAEASLEPTGLAAAARAPSSHRAYLAGTALTVPRGKVEASVHAPAIPAIMLFAAQAGLTDRIQLGVNAVAVPVADDGSGAIGVNGKIVLRKGARSAWAVTGSLHAPTVDGGSDERLTTLGLIYTRCGGGARCSTLWTVQGNALIVDESGSSSEQVIPLTLGGSVVAGGGRAKLLLEAHATNLQRDAVFVMAGIAGLRWAGQRVAVDAGLAWASVAESGNSDGGAFPLVALSYRP